MKKIVKIQFFLLILIKEIELINWNDYINYNWLFLGDSQIVSIEGIQNLTKLTILDLNNNLLLSINGIEKLTELISLRLSNNRIVSIQGI